MLCTAVSCTSTVDSGKGDSLLDMTDGPTSIGDRVIILVSSAIFEGEIKVIFSL